MSTRASSTVLDWVTTGPASWRRAWRDGVWRMVVAALLAVAAILVGTPGASATPPENRCPTGAFCVWSGVNHTGDRHEIDIRPTVLEQCTPLPQEFEVRSFANNTGRPVTVYQDARCASDAEFTTHPTGSHSPEPTFVVRAIKVWSH
ncbi:peptidase inhibitor family I36 protein [Saccharopolyspora sp. K220]|uniref:peptidase inhibitor family I36 protein n=1 Tax=Saccharopolyspora soli TaxID=2926618 RepID=UPI001F5A3997|nr:peptidase inhibitor family I36 protein [Saccharopolyspora soli]MCI2423811.1 peptidase inhibitor family I36 protein [Saccharopolyspora soli]